MTSSSSGIGHECAEANERRALGITTSLGTTDSLHQLSVDHSERHSGLLDAVHLSGKFDVRMAHLDTGDYLIANEVLVERKSVADLAVSLVDGRLFPQVARLAHSQYRSLLLIEGPTPASIPDIHPHSLEGALVSIAAMWRLPVLQSSDSEQSARMLRFLADQVRGPHERILRRFDRKPKGSCRGGSSCCKSGQESDRRLRTVSSAASVQSNGSSPSTPPRWPRCEALAQ